MKQDIIAWAGAIGTFLFCALYPTVIIPRIEKWRKNRRKEKKNEM